ncbi:MAG TPA: FmdB family transcriptional regulator [Myxococcales bacterium]|nr:FmdB family transcriptional regulator [Myxococcales bacterium]
MPLYEYRCDACAIRFEELVRSQTERVRCPKCGTDAVKRQMSTFAMHGSRSGSDAPPPTTSSRGSGCGGCSGGSCSSCHG